MSYGSYAKNFGLGSWERCRRKTGDGDEERKKEREKERKKEGKKERKNEEKQIKKGIKEFSQSQ
jgi:hypothetical protein